MHTTTSVSSVYVHTHINIYTHESYATHVVGDYYMFQVPKPVRLSQVPPEHRPFTGHPRCDVPMVGV